ncbi:rod shape-determining protein MreC [Glacieibacterium sp.]|uniref:rod shape-determining protein MreC n=1 Tax=Glacieibacterium sp. TaxID=2860237 RepID=UPI003AFF7BA9
MDWSPPSRRSASRREQNLALIGAVLSGIVIAFGLLLLLIGRVNPEQGDRLRAAALDIVTPLWSIVRAPFDGAARITSDTGDYLGTVSKNRALTAELNAQRATLQQASAMAAQNVQLKRLLKVVEPNVRLIATARLAGASSGSYIRSAVISAGRVDGVVPGLPVRSASGLVGRTLEAGNHATRVLLLTDPGSRIPVILQRTGEPAIAVGANGPLLEIRDRGGAEVPLRIGDHFVTSGDGGVFPPGIPVATVATTGEPAKARLATDPNGLGFVLIQAAYLPVPAPPPASTTAPVPVPREAGGGTARKKLVVTPVPAPPKTGAAAVRPAVTPPAAARPTPTAPAAARPTPAAPR